MSFQVSVQPSQHSFQAQPEETILDAALRQGCAFPTAVAMAFAALVGAKC
jgi:hypothetical protein